MQRKILQTSTTLSEKEEKRFEEFFAKFSRNGSQLTFSELLMFALDRSIIHNKIGFSLLHHFFEDAMNQNAPIQQQQQQDRPVYGIQERGLTRHQFSFLLSQLSFYLYHNDKHHLDRLLSEILAEKTAISKDQSIEIVRNMIYDETNKRLLSENAIKAICEYEEELKHIFTIYIQDNYAKGYIMLRWFELAIQNRKMNMASFIKFVREADIVPNILSIEQLEEILMKMIPPANNREHDFYQKGKPVELYENDEKADHLLQIVEGDPMISFHEFEMLLARVAVEFGMKEDGGGQNAQKKDPDRYIHHFFGELMHFRRNDMILTQSLPKLNRKLIKNLEKFANDLQMDKSDDEEDELIEEIKQIDDDPVQKIAQEMQQQLFDKNITQLDLPFEQIIKQLEKDLPPLPPRPESTKEEPQWNPEGRQMIGDPPPAPPADKNKPKASKPKQKQRRKQGEKEPRKVIFENPQKENPKTSEEYLQDLSDKLQFEQKLLSNVERGTMSDIQVIPVLIPEILYPPNPPAEVRTFVEAGINAHNEGNFLFAIQNYDTARKLWSAIDNRDLPDAIELYFEYSKASVYESAGRDDLALQHFLNARIYGNKLPTNNPDRALAFCGLGLVFYNIEEYEYGLRSFLKARESRESVLGIETVDTATVFNNLGCCMFMLDRNQESYAYFKLAHAIFESHLGPFHTRTLTAGRNIIKSNKNFYENLPEYKKVWVTYVPDPFGAVAKKKKKKKGKK